MKHDDLQEWYFGSDNTGIVTPILARAIDNRCNEKATDQDILDLRKVLQIEKSDNWRGFTWGMIGLILWDMGIEEEAMTSFSEAMRAFRPLEDNFYNVSNIYCQASAAYGDLLWKNYQVDKALKSYLQCLHHMEDIFNDFFIGSIYYSIGRCLNKLDRDEESRVFLEHAYLLLPDKCSTLEMLMIVNNNLGETEIAIGLYDMFLTNCQNYEVLERVVKFAEQSLGIKI